MMGFILITVLLLLGIGSFKADEGDTITTTPILIAAELTEDSGTSAQVTEMEDPPEKKLRSRYRRQITSVASNFPRIGNGLNVIEDFETYANNIDVEDGPNIRLISRDEAITPPRVNNNGDALTVKLDDDDDDWTYNPGLTSGKGKERFSFDLPPEKKHKHNKVNDAVDPAELIPKIIAGVFALFIVGGLSLCCWALWKRKGCSKNDPEYIVPILPSQEEPDQTASPPPKIYTSQYGYHQTPSSSHQTLIFSQKMSEPSSSHQTLIVSQQMTQPYPYPAQSFIYPQEHTIYPPPKNLKRSPRT